MLARRRLWFEGQAGLAPERLIFIDQTGASMKMARLRGWSRKGERCRAAIPHGHWKTTTLTAGLRLSGAWRAPMLLDGPMHGAAFKAYVEQVLVPELDPGDSVVMDTNWDIACDIAAQYGNAMDRSQWRMIGLVHVAETKEQAIADVQFGIEDWVQYFEDVAVIPMVPPDRRADPVAHLTESSMAAIGTPDDVIRQVETLWEASDGGFGCFLITDHSWAPFEAKLKSYDMIARYVFPHFQKQNVQREESNEWVRKSQKNFKASHEKATAQQIERHNKEVEARNKSAAAE